MDALRMQFDSEGNIVDTSLEAAMKAEQATPPSAPRQIGAARYVVDTTTGAGRFETSQPREYRAAPVESQGVTVRSNAGPITLAQATGADIINIPALQGETNIATALSLGYVVPRAGGGYELTALAQSQQPQQQAGQQKPTEKPKADEEAAGDPTGVEPTSLKTDQTLSAIESRTPQALEGLITSLSQTGEIPTALVEDMARQHDVDPAQMQADVNALVADHTRAARQAIARVDASINPDSFQAWLLKSPELADRVTRGIMAKSVAEVQAAAREYAKNRDGAIESALIGSGVDTTRIEGKLYVSRKALGLAPKPRMGDFPASDWISADEAQRAGHLTFNEI